MKPTAITKAIQEIDKQLSDPHASGIYWNGYKSALEIQKEILQLLLTEERDDLQTAFEDGGNDYDGMDGGYSSPADYFNTTFTQHTDKQKP